MPCFPVDGHICGPELPCSSIMCYSKELLNNIRYRVELRANVCKTNCLCIMGGGGGGGGALYFSIREHFCLGEEMSAWGGDFLSSAPLYETLIF